MSPTPLPLRTFKRQQMLPKGSYWHIREGLIRSITWDEEGNIIALGLWGPGDIVSSQLSSLDLFELECQTRVVVEALETETVDRNALMTQHFRCTEQLLSISRTRRAEIRLARLLEWLARRFGLPEMEGYTIHLDRIYLTHGSLGDLNCSTRVTITRLLNSFEVQGAIAYHSRRTMWINPGKLPHRAPGGWLRAA